MVLKNNNKEYKEVFAYGTITLFGPAFQQSLTNQPLFYKLPEALK